MRLVLARAACLDECSFKVPKVSQETVKDGITFFLGRWQNWQSIWAAYPLVDLCCHAWGKPFGKPGALRMLRHKSRLRPTRSGLLERSRRHMLWSLRTWRHHLVYWKCSPKNWIWTSLGLDGRSGAAWLRRTVGAVVQHRPFCCGSNLDLPLAASWLSTPSSIAWKMAWKQCSGSLEAISGTCVSSSSLTRSHGIARGFRQIGTGSALDGILSLAYRTLWSGKNVASTCTLSTNWRTSGEAQTWSMTVRCLLVTWIGWPHLALAKSWISAHPAWRHSSNCLSEFFAWLKSPHMIRRPWLWRTMRSVRQPRSLSVLAIVSLVYVSPGYPYATPILSHVWPNKTAEAWTRPVAQGSAGSCPGSGLDGRHVRTPTPVDLPPMARRFALSGSAYAPWWSRWVMSFRLSSCRSFAWPCWVKWVSVTPQTASVGSSLTKWVLRNKPVRLNVPTIGPGLAASPHLKSPRKRTSLNSTQSQDCLRIWSWWLAQNLQTRLHKASILDSRFSILDSRFSILDSRFSILDSRFSILDSRFSILDSRFSILDSRFSILDSRFSILHSRFSILDSRFSILDSRFSILDSRLSILDSRFSRLSILDSRLLILDSRFSILDSRLSILGSRFSILDSRFSILDSRFSILDSRFSISILDSQFSILDSRLSILDSRFSILDSRLSILDSRSPILNSRLSTLDFSISRLSILDSRLSVLDARFSTLDSRFSILASRFSILDSRFSILDSRLSTLDSRFSTLDSRFSTLDSRFSILDSRLSTLGSRLSILDSRFSILDSRFSILDSRFSILDSRLSILDSRFSRLSILDSRLLILDSRFSTLDSRFSILDSQYTRFSTLESRFSILDSRFSILDSRFSILDSRFSILDSRFSILDSPLSILDSRFSILDSRFSILDSRFSILDFLDSRFRFSILNSRFSILGSRLSILDSRFSILDSRSSILDFDSRFSIFSILDSRFSILDSRLSILDSRFSVLDSRFSILDSRLSILDSRFSISILGSILDSRFSRLSILDSRFSILDSRFSTLDSGFSILDSRFSILDSRFSILDSRFSIPDSGFSILDSRFSILDSRFSVLGSRFSILDLDSRFSILDSRFLILDSRFSTLDSRLSVLDSRFSILRFCPFPPRALVKPTLKIWALVVWASAHYGSELAQTVTQCGTAWSWAGTQFGWAALGACCQNAAESNVPVLPIAVAAGWHDPWSPHFAASAAGDCGQHQLPVSTSELPTLAHDRQSQSCQRQHLQSVSYLLELLVNLGQDTLLKLCSNDINLNTRCAGRGNFGNLGGGWLWLGIGFQCIESTLRALDSGTSFSTFLDLLRNFCQQDVLLTQLKDFIGRSRRTLDLP